MRKVFVYIALTSVMLTSIAGCEKIDTETSFNFSEKEEASVQSSYTDSSAKNEEENMQESLYTDSSDKIDGENSFNFSEKEKEAMQESPLDKVIKIYGLSFLYDFSQRKSIRDIIGESTGATYMVISEQNGIIYKNFMHDGKVNTIIYGKPNWSEFIMYAECPQSVFDSTTIVYNIYCLDGNASHDGVYIYYSTNKGDYVLYKEFMYYDEIYLFPIEDFYNFAKAVHQGRKDSGINENGELMDGTPSIKDFYDVEPYIFN